MSRRVVQPPSMQTRIMSPDGVIDQAWLLFFTSLVALPSEIEELVPGGSPYSYAASVPGNLLVIGGAVNSVNLTRARVTVPLVGIVEGFIPLGQKDEVEIDYAVVPDVWFIPS